MKLSQFVRQLPTLYQHWGQSSITPKSDRFAAILDLEGRATANVLQLLNAAIVELEPGEIYCEIGCGTGTTVIGALLGQDDRLAYAVDNLTDRDPICETALQLSQNVAAFGLEEQVFFCDQTFEAFFADLRDLQPEERIGVYFYNGAHDYRSQLLALLLVKPFLANQALIVLGESNWEMGQQATLDFLAAHPQAKLLLDLSTSAIDDPSFGNGLQVLSWNVQVTEWAIAQPRKPDVIAAIANLEDWKFQLQEAQALQKSGQWAEAKQHYLELLNWQVDRPEIWCGFGEVLENLGDILGAAGAYRRAIAIDAQMISAHNSLGNLVAQQGDPDQAVIIYRQAIAIDPDYLGVYLNLGNVLLVLGDAEEAIATYAAALAIEPQNPDVLHNLNFARKLAENETELHLLAGSHLYDRKRYALAANHFQVLVDCGIANASVYESLADCYEKLKQLEAAIAAAQAGVDRYPIPSLYMRLIRLGVDSGQIQLALDYAAQACEQFPDDGRLRLKRHLLLPIVYSTPEEIRLHRDRFTHGLTTLIQELSPTVDTALDATSDHTNFFLGYQGQDDRELQQQYGKWVQEIMAARYPQWAQPQAMPAVTDKIRLGYVSGCLHDHTVGKLIVGWFRHHDRDRFQIHSYQVFEANDALTQEFRQHSDRFYSFSDDLEAICEQIRADQPHILVFPEIGMQPLMTQLAALRLAPVQCATWGHPITTGLPTVDYFLSSDLMEPEDGATHYTEHLIRLPNLGIAFAKPEIPPPAKTRSDFGLRSDSVVYLVSQTLCKILPHQDQIFVTIGQQVPQSQFVFVARPNAAIGAQFQQRLQVAFAVAGLDVDRVLMLPPQGQTDFWNLNQVCDVFLDSFDWSGGHTTLEAIACDLPIVTLPGEFMRGRHSFAILQMLGMTETIAGSEADYIQIATRLGLDPAWRTQLVQKMRDRHDYLYNDRACVQAMESFYQTVIHH